MWHTVLLNQLTVSGLFTWLTWNTWLNHLSVSMATDLIHKCLFFFLWGCFIYNVCVCVFSCRMPFHFCPQCGTKLQPGFRFCPSCGEKLPCPADESVPVSSTASLSLSPPRKTEAAATSVVKASLTSSTSSEPAQSKSPQHHVVMFC